MAIYITDSNGNNLFKYEGNTFTSFPTVKHLSGERIFSKICQYCTDLTTVSFPELISVSGECAFNEAFYNCFNLTSVSFPKLTSISGTEAFGYVFNNCAKLTYINFPELTTLSGENLFEYCFNATTAPNTRYTRTDTLNIYFPKLSELNNATFGTVTSDWSDSVKDLVTMHFPAALKSVGVTANRVKIAFDL